MAVPSLTVIRDALLASHPEVKRAGNWRDSLRRQVGPHAEVLHEILLTLAKGNAWMAELPDGRCSVPVLPSSDVRLRAAIYLHEALLGKAVAQTEIQKAEHEAREIEAIRALSDDELEAEAVRILHARHVNAFTPGANVAEFTVEREKNTNDLTVPDLALSIWNAVTSDEAE